MADSLNTVCFLEVQLEMAEAQYFEAINLSAFFLFQSHYFLKRHRDAVEM